MRGTVRSLLHMNGLVGIIPACAGNRKVGLSNYKSRRDHPRVCGEQIASAEVTRRYLGSSPRVRGTGRTRSSLMNLDGIIPACAGNRPRVLSSLKRLWDHPRVCGEQPGGNKKDFPKEGSSPRVRGTGTYHCVVQLQSRIIPACAGNRSLALSSQQL